MDDFDQFGVELERECLTVAFARLVEIAGEEEAIRLWKPFCELSGKAIALNMQEWMRDDDLFTKLAKMAVMMQLSWGGKPKRIRASENELVVETENCPYLGTLPMICKVYCGVVWSAAAKEINAEVEVESIPGIGPNDPRCINRLIIPIKAPFSNLTNREYDVESIMDQISEEDLRWRSHIFSGGVWFMLTYAMVNSLGPEKTLDILSDPMKRNGAAIGLRIRKGLADHDEPISMLKALELFSQAVLQSHTLLADEPDDIRVKVDNCMWCGHDYSTPEHCRLIEIINDSICKSISPDHEFRYLSMRPKGDEECVWTIRRIASRTKDHSSSQKAKMNEPDPLTILKVRLAKGEISLEEYQRISKVL